MAADSVVGAIGNNLSEESKAILTQVFEQIKGNAAYVDVGAAKAVFGTESAGVIVGVLPAGNAPISGNLKDSNFEVNVDFPASIGLKFKGPATDVSVDSAAAYFNELISAALPPTQSNDPAVHAKSLSLQVAVDVVKSMVTDSKTSVRYLELTNGLPTTAGGNVKIFGAAGGNEVVAINTAQLNSQDLEKVILVNQADVIVTGTKAALVVGDNSNQKITGGQGADTLVGGGGSDTLVGGLGSDTFGFVAGGRYQIGDLDLKNDKIAFSIAGINNFQDLAKLVTKVQETNAGVTYTFGDAGTITLMGVKNSDITADLIHFTIGDVG
jgi:Ca2+-binding RTX toxin-like protein